MPVPPRIFSPEALADARYRYEETDEPNASIARRLGISERTFSRDVVKWGWERRRQSARKQMAQAAPDPVASHLPALTPEDEAAAADIEVTVQHTIAAIRMIVARLPKGRSVSAAERSARALATLTRTLQEVIRLRPKQTSPSPRMTADPTTTTNLFESLFAAWTNLPDADKPLFPLTLPEKMLERWHRLWGAFSLSHQCAPLLAQGGMPWTTWLILGGRGAGKTRAGAEWVRAQANDPAARVALIGETARDVREVMIEGVSGLLSVHEYGARPTWEPSRGLVTFESGAIAQAFSAEDPDSLRGPQFSAAWCDELAKWRHAEATFDMLQFGLRLGTRPRQVITTTPRPIALLKRLIADPATALTHAGTAANAYNLAPSFLDTIVKRYQGTQLGRQELDGEIIEERSDALWTRARLEACRVEDAPACSRIVVAVDPPGSAGKDSSACGLIAAGRHGDLIYVLADETAAGLSPAGWANKAIALWRRLEADCLVVEVNQGGDMVRAVIRSEDANVPVTPVRAHRGKYLRAEPIAAFYEQGRVKHVGVFPELEDEMCDFGPDGLSSGRSPDRLDALVWAVSALTTARPQPRVRVL